MINEKNKTIIHHWVSFFACAEKQNTTPHVNKWWENYLDYQYLDLGGNDLTGDFPVEIGDMTNLIELALYNNELTGSLPPEIGNLTNLTYLNLYDNQLTGSLPQEIGNLTNMTMLKLHYNELNGKIPESLCELNITWSDTSRFTIYNNHFCPPYPSCIENYVGYQDTTNCN